MPWIWAWILVPCFEAIKAIVPLHHFRWSVTSWCVSSGWSVGWVRALSLCVTGVNWLAAPCRHTATHWSPGSDGSELSSHHLMQRCKHQGHPHPLPLCIFLTLIHSLLPLFCVLLFSSFLCFWKLFCQILPSPSFSSFFCPLLCLICQVEMIKWLCHLRNVISGKMLWFRNHDSWLWLMF